MMSKRHLLLLLVFLVGLINWDSYGQRSFSKYSPPQTWRSYEFGYGSCGLSIPPTMELRKTSDSYTQRLKDMYRESYRVNANSVVFQQKGLGLEQKSSFSRYARIMLNYTAGVAGDFLKRNETVPIDSELRNDLEAMVYQDIQHDWRIISDPTIKWIDISGNKGLEIVYRRTGAKNTSTTVRRYLFQNNDRMVHIIISVRDTDAKHFQPELSNVIRTFYWN